MTLAADIARCLLLLAGLLLPGTGWALAARWPLPWFAGGLLSALAIFVGVLGLAAAGVGINLGSLGLWLGAVALAGWLRWWRGRDRMTALRFAWPAEGWLGLLLTPMVGVAIWKAVAQPLSGADAAFRWSLLGELIVETGSLDFYPPRTAADFGLYFWADGISPLMGGIYAWTYLAAGSMAKGWTAIPVLLQVAGLLAVLFGWGRLGGSARAGWFACALGGATMLLQFGFNLGQESGLLALGAGAMLFYLALWRDSGHLALLVPAAIGAAVAACAREYGALAAVAGTVGILAGRRDGRAAAVFAVLAAVLPLWWHGRVWVLTGNPLYAQEFAGFPTNPVFAAWMNEYRLRYGSAATAAGATELARILVLTALPALAGLGAGILRRPVVPGWSIGVVLTLLFGAAWWASIPFTGGGPFYSMRVLGPVLVVGCAWGGVVLARLVPGRRHLGGVVVALALFGTDAALRAWTIPQNPYALAPREWPAAGYQMQRDFERDDDPFLRAAARVVDGRVLTDSAGLRDYFRREGKICAPLWSPDVAWLFSGHAGRDAAARLRALGYSHLLMKQSPITFEFLQKSGVIAALDGHVRVVMQNPTFLLFELTPGPGPG
jgi:hypothetical protein